MNYYSVGYSNWLFEFVLWLALSSKAHIPNIHALNSDTHTLRIQYEYTQKQCVGVAIEGMDIWYMGITCYMQDSLSSDSQLLLIWIKAHELGCRHDWVHCAEIICQISNLGVSEIAHIEIESYVAQQALQHHFSGRLHFSLTSDWS